MRRRRDDAILVQMCEPSKKGELFCHGEVFFLLTRPSMGDSLQGSFIGLVDLEQVLEVIRHKPPQVNLLLRGQWVLSRDGTGRYGE